MVAIHGEYNTLHLAGLPLMLEMYCHSLPFQVGDKHVPVAASAVRRMGLGLMNGSVVCILGVESISG